jgi:hypothetical protein
MPQRSRYWLSVIGAPALLLALSAGFTGCATATRYDVKIDAAVNPAAVGGYSYAIAARDAGRTNDARYVNVIDRVHVALSQRGMYEAPIPARADVIIDVDYGELPPQSKVTTVTQPVVLQPDPFASSYPGHGGYPTGNVDPITGQPRSQIAMVQTQRITYTTEKYIRISARENGALQGKPASKGDSVWLVEATLEDENSNFDAALPAMIDAAIEYMGTNTGGQVKVKVQLEG